MKQDIISRILYLISTYTLKNGHEPNTLLISSRNYGELCMRCTDLTTRIITRGLIEHKNNMPITVSGLQIVHTIGDNNMLKVAHV